MFSFTSTENSDELWTNWSNNNKTLMKADTWEETREVLWWILKGKDLEATLKELYVAIENWHWCCLWYLDVLIHSIVNTLGRSLRFSLVMEAVLASCVHTCLGVKCRLSSFAGDWIQCLWVRMPHIWEVKKGICKKLRGSMISILIKISELELNWEKQLIET